MRRKSFTTTSCFLLALTMITSVFMQVEGTTWSVNTRQLTTYEFTDGYPALLQTSDGKIWLIWSKEIQGNLTLYYKTTSDLGRTWSNEMNLTNLLAPGQNQNPSAIQAENGTIWVVWTSDRPPPPSPPLPSEDFYMNATPSSLTIPLGESDNSTISVTSVNNFNDTVNLYASYIPGVTSVLDPNQVYVPQNETVTSLLTVTVDATATPGNYTLTVMGEPLNHKFVHGVDITLEITNSTMSSSNTQNLISPSDSSTETQIEDYEIYYKTSHDNGANWSRDIPLTVNSADDLRPSIIQLTNGTIMIFWQAWTSGSFNIVYQTTTDGISWSEMKELTTDPAHDKGPMATQTKDGNIWVVWASDRHGDNEIYYKIYNGTSWSNDTRLTYSPNSDVEPTILQAINEEILIFWASSPTTTPYNIYYKYLPANSSTWSDPIEFVASNYDDLWPATTQTHDTKIWVAWMSETENITGGEVYTNFDIYFKTSLAGDVNEDGIVNALDLGILSLSYGYFEGEPEYNPDADLNKDGIVDTQDLAIVTYYMGTT